MLSKKFDYNLPKEKIAFYPPQKRGTTKLMVIDRKDQSITHRRYSDLPDYFELGDVAVVNKTKVEKRRLFFLDTAGREHEVLFLPSMGQDNECLIGNSKVLEDGDILKLKQDEEVNIKLIKKDENDGIWSVNSSQGSLKDIYKKYGHVPLPPYIKREDHKEDEVRYNTVFAKEDGSAASPTASINLTSDIISKIRSKGAQLEEITLHVGWGTFAPVRTENIEDHHMHSEQFILEEKSAQNINGIRERGGQIFAFGTTVTRVLESCVGNDGDLMGRSSQTDIYIYPGYNWKIVDHLITNFHAPKTTLLALVSSFMGYDLMMRAYNEALENDYAFLSYGDSMLIL